MDFYFLLGVFSVQGPETYVQGPWTVVYSPWTVVPGPWKENLPKGIYFYPSIGRKKYRGEKCLAE